MTMPPFRLAAALGVLCAGALAAPAHAQLLQHKDLTASIAHGDRRGHAGDLQGQRLRRVGDRGRPNRRDHPAGARRRYQSAHHGKQFPQSLHRAHHPRRRPARWSSASRPTRRSARHLSNIIAIQGALPIKLGDEVIGAAGASGAPGGEKDEACVKAALDKVADQLK